MNQLKHDIEKRAMEKTAKLSDLLGGLFGKGAPELGSIGSNLKGLLSEGSSVGGIRSAMHGDIGELLKSKLTGATASDAIQKYHDMASSLGAFSPSLKQEALSFRDKLRGARDYDQEGALKRWWNGMQRPELNDLASSNLDDSSLSVLSDYGDSNLNTLANKLKLIKDSHPQHRMNLEAALRGLSDPIAAPMGALDENAVRDYLSHLKGRVASETGMSDLIQPLNLKKDPGSWLDALFG